MECFQICSFPSGRHNQYYKQKERKNEEKIIKTDNYGENVDYYRDYDGTDDYLQLEDDYFDYDEVTDSGVILNLIQHFESGIIYDIVETILLNDGNKVLTILERRK